MSNGKITGMYKSKWELRNKLPLWRTPVSNVAGLLLYLGHETSVMSRRDLGGRLEGDCLGLLQLSLFFVLLGLLDHLHEVALDGLARVLPLLGHPRVSSDLFDRKSL